MNNKIAYIIPLHKEDERVFRAILSVPSDSSIVVCTTKKISNWFENKERESRVKQIISEKSSYPALVNAGIEYLKDFDDIDFINILEFDDIVVPQAHEILNEYSEDWKNVEIFAPLTCVVTWEDEADKPTLVGITNEASLAPQLAEEYGYVDFNMMLRSNFVFVNGCYIRPSVFENYGRFKENFEMFYDYEWALRMVYNGVIIRTIPKVTHFHSLSSDGAFENYKLVSEKIRDKWLSATRREYFFEEDRKIVID